MQVDLHLPACNSLKAKRAIIRPLIEALKRRFNVACAEVEGMDRWQVCSIGVTSVSNEVRHLTELLDSVERFIWAQPGLEVLRSERYWMEQE